MAKLVKGGVPVSTVVSICFTRHYTTAESYESDVPMAFADDLPDHLVDGTGNWLVVRPFATNKQIRDQPDVQLKVFSLQNADSEELSDALKELFSNDKSNPVYVATEARTNSIIILGPGDKLTMIESLVLRLDEE